MVWRVVGGSVVVGGWWVVGGCDIGWCVCGNIEAACVVGGCDIEAACVVGVVGL